MTGDIVVAVIALVGVLLPVYLGASVSARDRRSMKETAELLEALPDDLEQAEALKNHLNTAVAAYIARAEPEGAKLRALRTRSIWLGVGAIVVTVGGTILAFSLMPWSPRDRYIVYVLIGVSYLLFAGAISFFWLWRMRSARADIEALTRQPPP